MQIKKLFALFSLCFVCLTAGAKGWYYQNIAAPEGLSDDFVCAHVQKNGYAWGGMSRGLFRYGYYNECRWYYADGSDRSLPGDYIFNLGSDPSGRLWVFTDKGVAIYNEASDDFFQLRTTTDGVPANIIGYTAFKAKDGKYYIGGDDVIYIYDLEADKVLETIQLSTGSPFRIEDMMQLPASPDEIGLFNKRQGFIRFQVDTHAVEPSMFPLWDNYAYLLDSRGRFWRSQYNKGVECYSFSGELLASYNTSNSELGSNIVTSFLENNGSIWIGTDGGGISILDPENGSMLNFVRDDSNFNSFPCYAVKTMCIDASNSVWAVRPDAGVLVLREVYMRSVAVAPVADQMGRSSDEVMCFAHSERAGVIWLGTASSGLYRFNPETRNSDVQLTKVKSVGNHKVESMVALPDGRLLMSFASEGLFLYNPSNDQVTPFQAIADPGFLESMRFGGQSVSLSLDNLGHVMILSDELRVWDPSTGAVSRLPIPELVSGETVHPVSHGEGRYFHCGHHLYSWDSLAQRLELIFDIGPDIYINSVTMDSTGMFWIATDQGVFFKIKEAAEATMLESGHIVAAETVMADAFGRIWIATSSAMFVYLPQLDNLMRFSDNDGANWNKYNGRAWFSSDTHILFGGSNGMLVVDPSLNFYLTDQPEIVIQDVVLNGRRLNESPRALTLTSTFKTLRITVFAKENNILRSKKFRFTIQGPYENTVESDSPSVEYSLLPRGKHTVSVSCTLQNGEWTEPLEIMTLRVLPVWYKAWWFWGLIALLMLAIVHSVFHSLKSDAEFKLALAESEAENKAGQDSLRFLLNVSHELKTPLTLIISPLSRLLKHKDKTDPEYTTLTNIYRQANRMSSLILTVLDSHKIQDGSASFIGEKVEMNQWVERHASDFEEEALSRKINLLRSYDDTVGLVNIDSQKLENVITNMMINALKHSTDNTNITVGTKMQDNDVVRVFVSDQGEGLGGVDMTKLFSRFYQGYAQKTGSGLGLAYANSIVELHHGSMGAYENKGAGATFYFDIPAAGGASPAVISPIAPSAPSAPATAPASVPVADVPVTAPVPEVMDTDISLVKDITSASILVVDDDQDLREYLIDELTQTADRVYSASNGQRALEFVRKNKVDIIISDVMMPVMDGFEFCSIAKQDPALSRIPFILLTARVEAKSRDRGLSLGADAYLPKPFENELLVKTVNELLGKASS